MLVTRLLWILVIEWPADGEHGERPGWGSSIGPPSEGGTRQPRQAGASEQ